MAKKPGQVKKTTGQDVPLYMVWLRNKWESLVRTFGLRLAVVLVALTAASVLVVILILEVSVIGLVTGLIWYLDPDNKLPIADRKALVQGIASVAQAAAVGLAGAVGLVGLFFTWRSLRQTRKSQEETQQNTLQTLRLTEQGQITERFTRAIDQLGATDDNQSPQIEIRLGGIYALERIATDSPKRDYTTVMEILSAYVRENTRQAPEASKPAADIQAVLDVLRRVQTSVSEAYHTSLDLHEANLRGADFRGAILRGADLRGTDLRGAHLEKAIVRDADLLGAKLEEVILRGADLQGAILRTANLYGAILREATLRDADLRGAKLQSANLRGTDFRGADLRGADLRDAQDASLDDTKSLRGAIMPNGRKHR